MASADVSGSPCAGAARSSRRLPAVAPPQFLLGGLLAPTDRMAVWLDWLSRVMRLRYAVAGRDRLTGAATVTGPVWPDLIVVLGCALVALLLGARTHHRTTA
jgi:ABC-2 type transport system permease protein